MTTTYIYALVDPRDGAIRYVGKTVDIKIRLVQHFSDGGGAKRKHEWLRELRTLSLAPEVKILAEVDSENCFIEEKVWIKKMIADGCDLVNGNMGGGGRGEAKNSAIKKTKTTSFLLSEEEWKTLKLLKSELDCFSLAQVFSRLLADA